MKRANVSQIEKEFALEWTSNDCDKINGDYNYDCLLFFLSCHFQKLCDKSDKHILYDSNGDEYSLNDKIFDIFNNIKCLKLNKKAKIFILDGDDEYDNENNDDKIKDDHDDKGEMDKKNRF